MAEKIETPTEEEQKEKEAQIEERLEKLGKAVETEVEEEKEKLEEEAAPKPKQGPITLFLKSNEVERQIELLKDLTETGMAKTQKNVIVFYKRATDIGDRVRGLLFFFLGFSIIATGLLATPERLFSLKDLLLIINTWAGGWLGRIIVAGIGISLMAYGVDKMLSGLREKFFPPKKKPETYVQKKLT